MAMGLVAGPKVDHAPSGVYAPGKFCCTKCPKTFVGKDGLRRHMQQHTGRFSYWCDQCQRGFTVKCNYTGHMAKHEGRTFPCDLCDKRFQSLRGFQKHYTEHQS